MSDADTIREALEAIRGDLYLFGIEHLTAGSMDDSIREACGTIAAALARLEAERDEAREEQAHAMTLHSNAAMAHIEAEVGRRAAIKRAEAAEATVRLQAEALSEIARGHIRGDLEGSTILRMRNRARSVLAVSEAGRAETTAFTSGGGRQVSGETGHQLHDRLLTELQETGKCIAATLSVAEVAMLVETLGFYMDECFIDAAGFLYVRKRPGVPTTEETTG